MCLEKASLKKVAEKDIRCYKIVRDDLVSPCYNFQYAVGVTVSSKLGADISGEIYEGLHTFVNLNDAIKALDANWINRTSTGELMSNYASIVLECLIPKGSEYYTGKCWIGKYNRHFDSFASEKLTINKIVYSE